MDPAVRLPLELFHMILSNLREDDDVNRTSLSSCALVCRAWRHPSQEYIFDFLNVDLSHEHYNAINFIPFLKAHPHLVKRVLQLELTATDDAEATLALPITTIASILDLLPNLQAFYLRGVCIDDFEILPEGFFESRLPRNIDELDLDSLRPSQTEDHPWESHSRSLPLHLIHLLNLFGNVDTLHLNHCISYGYESDSDEEYAGDMYRDLGTLNRILPHLRVDFLHVGRSRLTHKPCVVDVLTAVANLRLTEMQIDEAGRSEWDLRSAVYRMGKCIRTVNEHLTGVLFDYTVFQGGGPEGESSVTRTLYRRIDLSDHGLELRALALDTCHNLQRLSIVIDDYNDDFGEDLDIFDSYLELLPLLPRALKTLVIIWSTHCWTLKKVRKYFQEPDWDAFGQLLDGFPDLQSTEIVAQVPHPKDRRIPTRELDPEKNGYAVHQILKERLPRFFKPKARIRVGYGEMARRPEPLDDRRPVETSDEESDAGDT